MANYLNNELYKRFGLELEIAKVQKGFSLYTRTLIDDELGPICYPELFENSKKLSEIQGVVLREACRQMFLDFNKFDNPEFGFKWFLNSIFTVGFPELLIRLQILINLIYAQELIRPEFEDFINKLDLYLTDFPILGLTIKIFKNKAPQLLPSTSSEFGEEIKDALGLLEMSGKHAKILENYEDGLKEFLTTKTKAQLKDVVEDMYTSCDVLVQVMSGKEKSGLRSLFVDKNPIDIGLNGWQIKIFDTMRKWMDKIKHGVEKDFTKGDIEMIILLVSQFIKRSIDINVKNAAGK